MVVGSDLPADLRGLVDLWLKYDKDTDTRAEIEQLVEGKQWSELHARLDSRISFGTAGLRAKMEAGFSRMNSLTVLQASQGLARYIAEQFPERKIAVVGHDHRYNSDRFARVTLAAFLQLGFKVYYLCLPQGSQKEEFVHTPMVPFTINQVGASVGVMITASHNPKMDNGYKVYYANGCQIIPPHDRLIAKSIEENLIPFERAWDCDNLISEGLESYQLCDVKENMTAAYVNTLKDKLLKTHLKPAEKPWFIYTPMHGVGYEIFKRIADNVLGLCEDRDFCYVKEQQNPDPAFPTVNFPNPEEKGALDMAITLAKAKNISLVLANDPDADRFSAAVKIGEKWKQLTGNEIGFLFAFYEWEMYTCLDERFKKNHPLAMINSTVSSQMIKSMAEIENFHFEDTLTGFKWLGNQAKVLEEKGYYVPFGYEEAIGYMFPSVEHDKDGISAAIVFLQMYSKWQSEGRTLIDVLEAGYEKYGVFKEYNGYYVVPDPALTNKLFEKIRNSYVSLGKRYPSEIGPTFQVMSFRDLTVGFQSDTQDHKPLLPVDSSSQMITATLKPVHSQNSIPERVRFTIRGSGTEPKLKVYIEAVSNTEAAAQDLALQAWDALKTEWFKPSENGISTVF
ncbi:LAFE_0G07272g1_1 [Lachancea fermentati]|uniref:phosphopentomutase n=1 Tax=Lachancea fermentati TaxID=4955 RepID=A0A1G4MHQ5_LACFM|nr:LAFE_0G07272g1_1 [Lachancea fermentati]